MGTLSVCTCILWIGALTSGIAKQPALVVGSTLLIAMQIAYLLQQPAVTFSFSKIEAVVFAHVPLFALSGLFTFNAISTWNAFALGICCVAFFFAGSRLFTEKGEARFLFSALSLLTTLLCIVGGIQYLFRWDIPLNFFLGREGRITSLLGNSTFFASYLILIFPLILSQSLYQNSCEKKKPSRFILPAIIAVMLLTTQTRSSLFSFCVSLVVLATLLWERKNAKVAFVAFAFCIGGFLVWILIINPTLGARLATMMEWNDSSTFARRVIFWVGGVMAFAAAPIAGHGIGSFEQVILQFRSPEYWQVFSEDIVPHAHNELLEIAVEYGSIGLVILGTTVVLLLRRGILVARNSKGWERFTAAGLTSSLIAVSVDNLANVSLREAPVAALTWLLMGLLSSQLMKKENGMQFTFENKIPRLFSIAPLLLWGCFVFFYMSFHLAVFAADSHVLNGINLESRHNELAAQYEYQTAISLHRKNLLSHSLLSMSYLKTNQWQEALHTVDTLQMFSRSYPKSWLVKAFAYTRLREYPNALDAIRNELQLRTHPESYAVEAAIYRELGDSASERRALTDLLRMNIAGKTNYFLQQSCVRLIELSPSNAEKQDAFALFDALEREYPTKYTFFNELRFRAGEQKK